MASLAVGFSQIVKGVTGFGSALVAMPVLVTLFGPRDALAVMVGVDTVSGAVLLPGVRHRVHWPLVLGVFLPLLVGQYLGTTLLVSVPERPLAVGLGVLVAVFGSGLLYNPVPTGWGELDGPADSDPRVSIFGGVAGFLGGSLQAMVGAGGAPIVAWVRRHFTDHFGRAQLIAVFALGAVALWTQLTLRNGGLGDSGLRIAACLPSLFGGALLGQLLSGTLSREVFGRLVGALLIGAGAVLLLQ